MIPRSWIVRLAVLAGLAMAASATVQAESPGPDGASLIGTWRLVA